MRADTGSEIFALLGVLALMGAAYVLLGMLG